MRSINDEKARKIYGILAEYENLECTSDTCAEIISMILREEIKVYLLDLGMPQK